MDLTQATKGIAYATVGFTLAHVSIDYYKAMEDKLNWMSRIAVLANVFSGVGMLCLGARDMS